MCRRLVVAHPGWHGSYDQNAPLAEDLAPQNDGPRVADKIPISGYHFPVAGRRRHQQDGANYALKRRVKV